MKNILAQLEGGDRRSIGKSEQAVKDVSKDPALLADLIAGLLDADPVVRMRAADAVEKSTREHPDLLQPWKRLLLETGLTVEDKEVRPPAQRLPHPIARRDIELETPGLPYPLIEVAEQVEAQGFEVALGLVAVLDGAVEQAAGRQETVRAAPIHGALPGSFPIFGRYAPLQYPNWATKFLADALMLYDDCLQGAPAVGTGSVTPARAESSSAAI